MKRKKKNLNKSRPSFRTDERQPFHQHIRELRQRLFYIALSVIGVSLAAYTVQQHIVNILLAPSHGQKFIYTSPGGGLDFLFRVCVYTGIAVSLPVIIYQILKYLEPLIPDGSSRRFIIFGSIFSGIFAVAGVVFGYFVGLPAVLHFLFHQFTSSQIQALVTIQSYISFVTVYLLGSALLLQVPLIILFINRIKPLKPSSLFKNERWVILGAFVASGIMNPTTNVISQLMIAGPIIVMYQISIALVWRANRKSKYSPKISELIKKDSEIRAARLAVETKLETFGTELKNFSNPIIPVQPGTLASSLQTIHRHYDKAPTRSIKRRIYISDGRSSNAAQTD